MEFPILDKLEKTRANLKERAQGLRGRAEGRVDELKHRADELKHRAEERVEAGRGRVLKAEAQALEAAADALARAAEAVGERAPFLERGEHALREALVELRAGHEATLPVPGYEALNVKQVAAALPPLSQAGLRTLRAYEVRHKNRVTVLKELDKRLAPTA